jgi:hypothetical protein
MGIYADDVRVTGGSVKLHRSGTFDHANISKVLDYLPCESLQKMLVDLRRDHFKDESAVSRVRNEIKNASNTMLNIMTSDGIRRLLIAIDERTPEWMFVRRPKEMSVFRHSEIRELSEFPKDPSWTYVLKSARAKESRQIWREKDGLSVNTNLRVRLVTNNGVNALLGLSKQKENSKKKPNTNSIITIKIQQDQVDKLLASVKRLRIAIA